MKKNDLANFQKSSTMDGPVVLLQECIDLMRTKGEDYNSGTVRHVEYYRRGLDSIIDMCHQKILRITSVAEDGGTVNHESLQDSFKDLVNYAAYGACYLRGTLDGQDDIAKHRTQQQQERASRRDDAANSEGQIQLKENSNA
tara:strand:- start:11 stop:436 length:426 start_codon:yes stop_codon:yes gene_type:complete